MRIVTTPAELEPHLGGVLVPTMGALHAGHTALIEHAACIAAGRPIVVSIFVNPTQFAPGEDYERYPRTFDEDLAKAEAAGGRIIFAPTVETMYPEGQPDRFEPLPHVASEPHLEEAHRPQFFHGVCLVVRRLFEMVKPTTAIFGEKDYQQLLVIREMVTRLGLPIAIEGQPTIREADGLALSSRNAYLDGAARRRGLGLSRALAAAGNEIEQATAARRVVRPGEIERRMREVLAEHELVVDYAVVRDAATLLPLVALDRPARGLIAARAGEVRLIDNAALPALVAGAERQH
jgi:pantoate--beta-alanine ligase